MFLVLALATALATGVAVIVVTSLRPTDHLDAVVAIGVVTCAIVVVTVLIAGILSVLHPVGLVVTLLAVTGSVMVTLAASARAGRLREVSSSPAYQTDGPPVRTVNSARPAPSADQPLVRWMVVLVGVAGLGLAWQVAVAGVLPPFAYDAIGYRLTIVADWLQQGDIGASDLSLCCSRYPLNPELLVTWNASLGGGMRWVGLSQVPMALLGGAATAGLASSSGLTRSASVAAGALFVMTPVVLTQASTNYVDLTVAAWSLAALHAIVRIVTEPSSLHLVVAGLSTGLVLGSKGVGIVWAAALAATCVALLVVLGRRRSEIAVFLVLVVALGSFWAVRNWIEVSNPLAPFEVRVGDWVLFEGESRLSDVAADAPGGSRFGPIGEILYSWASDLRFWRQGSYDYQQRAGGLGPLWAWLGVASLAGLTVEVFRRRSAARIAIGLTLVVLVAQPLRWWSRFTLPLAALGAVAVAWVAGDLATRMRPHARVAVRTVVTLLGVAGVVLATHEVDPASGAESLSIQQVIAAAGADESDRSVARLFFPEYEFLEVIPHDATVIVDLRTDALRFVSPIFGPDLERTVLPADGSRIPAGSWVVTGRMGATHDAAASNPALVLRYADDIMVWGPGIEALDDG